MGSTQKYWNENIIDWEKSAYEKKSLGLVERIASKFRGSIRRRMDISLRLLAPRIKKKKVLDLGCGSGIFCFKLISLGASNVIGIDISSKAINLAKKRAEELDIERKCTFTIGNIKEINLPEVDITTGLGILDYNNRKELTKLFRKINSHFFLFSFSERNYSPIALMHKLYLNYKRCPSAYQYTCKEMKEMLWSAGFKNFTFIKDKELLHGVIVHNLT